MNKFQTIRDEIIQKYDNYLAENHLEFTQLFSKDDHSVEIFLEPYGGKFRAFYFYNPEQGNSTQIHLSTAFLTPELQNKGLTKNLISIMFDVAKKYNYETYVVSITNLRFHQKLLNRGALPVDDDSVQIVETTNLK